MTLTRILSCWHPVAHRRVFRVQMAAGQFVERRAWSPPSVACTTGPPWCFSSSVPASWLVRDGNKRIVLGRLEKTVPASDDLRRDGFLSVWALEPCRRRNDSLEGGPARGPNRRTHRQRRGLRHVPCRARIRARTHSTQNERTIRGAKAQVDWMLSGGVTLVLALLTYLFASVLLALVVLVLTRFGTSPRCRNVPSSHERFSRHCFGCLADPVGSTWRRPKMSDEPAQL